MYHKTEIITGVRASLINIQIQANIIWLAWKKCRNPIRLLQIMKKLYRLRKSYLGFSRPKKMAVVDGKYYIHLYGSGWKSTAYTRNIESEIYRISPVGPKINRFTNVFMALTARCPLHCEHCFEWDALNHSDKLTLPELKSIVSRFQEVGTSQIQFTGGEPMLRFNDIVEILKSSRKDNEFWLLTSGFNLTAENARILKQAGLTGVVVSLDHFEEEKHNHFRGNNQAYGWAINAIKSSLEAKLVTSVSLCAVRSIVNPADLMSYLNLARDLGVSFVQLIEPQAVGHYWGKNVELNEEQIRVLEDFYLKMNQQKEFRSYPLVAWNGYHYHHSGCLGGGNRHLYVDTDGDLNPCPFCRNKTGNALTADIEETAGRMQLKGCSLYPNIVG
ncbi:MAG: radical SAM protein [Lentimicrobium sp.]|nr:radical SAM protein [Lentimicrobium sp.]